MKKFKKGDHIIATKASEREVVHGGDYSAPVVEIQKDNSYVINPVEVLHVASHHYVIKGKWSNSCITFEETESQGFVKATRKMVELTREDS